VDTRDLLPVDAEVRLEWLLGTLLSVKAYGVPWNLFGNHIVLDVEEIVRRFR
jgi:hypothetical protein